MCACVHMRIVYFLPALTSMNLVLLCIQVSLIILDWVYLIKSNSILSFIGKCNTLFLERIITFQSNNMLSYN